MSRVRRDHLRRHSATWISMCCYTGDVVIYFSFHRNPFGGFGATEGGGRNLLFSITLAIGFYNRTSRDTWDQAIVSCVYENQ